MSAPPPPFELPTPAQIDAVLAHRPALVRVAAAEAPDLAPIHAFVEALYAHGFVQPFDWPAWQSEAERLARHPEEVDRVDLVTAQKLLTTHVRKDRFCDGHLAEMVRNGQIVRILTRLEALRA